jgi:hypothetical protein
MEYMVLTKFKLLNLRFSWMLFLVVASIQLSCSSTKAQQVTTPPQPSQFVTWDKQFVELGKIKKGEKRAMVFEMTNTSSENVKIDIIDHCTCTSSDYPRGVIAPGGKAKIDLVFDSTEKEADETIEARVIFTNTLPNGVPRIETLKYHFELLK